MKSTIHLREEQAGGHVSVIEVAVDAGWPGPPMHHHGFDEAFYVLEGELTFEVDGERLTARGGELAFAPRNSVHTLANLSGGPARYLLVCTPAGFERRFDPDDDRPTPEVTVVGPPIG